MSARTASAPACSIDSDDRPGAAQCRDRRGRVWVGKRARHVADVLDVQAASAKKAPQGVAFRQRERAGRAGRRRRHQRTQALQMRRQLAHLGGAPDEREHPSARARDSLGLAERCQWVGRVLERIETRDRVETASANGSVSRSPWAIAAPGTRRRANSSSPGAASRPVTSAPRSAASRSARPAPQPMSSSRVPSPTPSASNAAMYAGCSVLLLQLRPVRPR